MPEPTAAAALWPNLPRGTPEPVQRSERNESVAAAMYPRPQPKPPTNSDRESLLRGLRELNRKIDERMEREGRR
jgi:hypothetical protein